MMTTARWQRKTGVNIHFRSKNRLRVVHFSMLYYLITERHGDVVKKGARSTVFRIRTLLQTSLYMEYNRMRARYLPSALFDSYDYRQIVYTYPILKRKKQRKNCH